MLRRRNSHLIDKYSAFLNECRHRQNNGEKIDTTVYEKYHVSHFPRTIIPALNGVEINTEFVNRFITIVSDYAQKANGSDNLQYNQRAEQLAQCYKVSNVPQEEQQQKSLFPLADFQIKDLVKEIEGRGWKVTLSLIN